MFLEASKKCSERKVPGIKRRTAAHHILTGKVFLRDLDGQICEKRISFVNLSYVCPEPVLVK